MSLKDESSYSEKIEKTTVRDSVAPTQDSLISKLQNFQSSLEQCLSPSESLDMPMNSSTLFSSNLEEDNSKLSSSKINTTSSHLQLTQKTILNMLNTQSTTRILQKLLFEMTKEEIDNVVNVLSGKYRQIFKDKNGNWFCSDLVKVCNQEQRIKILNELSNTLCDDCVDKSGTHPIQELIKFSSSEEEYNLLLKSFNEQYKLTFVSVDQFGSYVLTKMIGHIPEKFRMKFNLLYVKIIIFISTQQFGVINAKEFVSCTKNDLIIRQLMDLVKDNFVNLVSNKYGKYLIERILDKWWNTNEGEEIKELIRENIKSLSANSNGDYIIDHYLKLGNKEEKIQLINTLRINSNNNMMKKDYSIFMKIMESLGQINNNCDINNNNFHNNNNNQNILSVNNLDQNNNIFNNRNQIPLSLNNFGNNNNFINNNQIPLSLNNFGNNNNFINSNQMPFLLNNIGNNNMMNNLALSNFNKKDIYYKNNNKRK